jgi:hypothetical protein
MELLSGQRRHLGRPAFDGRGRRRRLKPGRRFGPAECVLRLDRIRPAHSRRRRNEQWQGGGDHPPSTRAATGGRISVNGLLRLSRRKGRLL